MKKMPLIIPSLALLALGLLASCDSDSSTGSGSGSSASSLVGTWVKIDSDPELSSTGDTAYINRDTVYSIYSQDGSYTEVQRLWSKDVYSSYSDGQFHLSSGTYSGSWKVTGNQVTKSVTYEDVPETKTANFSVSGSTLTISRSSDRGNYSVVFHRYSGSIPGYGGITSTVSSPTFSPAGGTYTSAQTVFLSSAVTGATIYYTTDGSTPTMYSAVYTGAITVSASKTTLKAIAVKDGVVSSVGSATYAFTGDLTAVVDQGGVLEAGAQAALLGSFISIQTLDVYTSVEKTAADEASIDLCFFAMTNGAKDPAGTPTFVSPNAIKASLNWSVANKTIIVKTTKVASSFKTVQDIKDVIGSSTSEFAPAVTGGVYAVKLSNGKYAVMSVSAFVGSTASAVVSFRIIK